MTGSSRGDATESWAADVHRSLVKGRVGFVSYVPDGGLSDVLNRCHADESIQCIPLTSEQEGIPLAVGTFIGGRRSALLMQSSGVGNCVNMLSLPAACNTPLFMLVTMRGEWGEFNPWQVPMGQQVTTVLEAMGVIIYRVDHPEDAGPTVASALSFAYESRQRVAVVLSQRLIGAKAFL